MKNECRNDCTQPPAFPRRLISRPGLSEVAYRIGTYWDIREALLQKLNANPLLQGWTYRASDDPAIALLEGASILGDILTFYQQTYANEVFLRTARWRESIQDLVRLTGYRLSPAVGGRATLAIVVDGERPVVVPSGFPLQAQLEQLDSAADFETSQDLEAVPALSLFTLYAPTVRPNQFANDETVTTFAVETADLKGKQISLSPGDRLMLFRQSNGTCDDITILIVKEVQQQFNDTLITIEGAWTSPASIASIKAGKLGRTFRHFGHNAPEKVVGGSPENVEYHYISYDRGDSDYYPALDSNEIPLDREAPDIAIGSELIIEFVAKEFFLIGSARQTPVIYQLATKKSGNPHTVNGPHSIEIQQDPSEVDIPTGSWISRPSAVRFGERESFKATIAHAKPVSMKWGELTGAVTMITIVGEAFQASIEDGTNIRNLAIHELLGKSFELRPVRVADSASNGTHLQFYGDRPTYELLDQRPLYLVRNDGAAMHIKVANTDAGLDAGDGCRLRPLKVTPTINDPFSIIDDFPLTDPIVAVYGNLVEATQGKTERKVILGNGDSREVFQTFKLPKAPLTYHNSASETPPEVPELSVYVNDILATRVPTLFGCSPDELVYIVREDADDTSWIQFGDRKTGACLPSGVGNVVAVFRTGSGAKGPLKPDTKVKAQAKLAHLKEIAMPEVATGGDEAESGDKARLAAPGRTQALGRIVSLRDFESEVLQIPGVSMVSGSWQILDGVPSVVLTVLMESGREQEYSSVSNTIAAYNRCRGSRRFPVRAVPGARVPVYLTVSFGFDPAYQEDLVKLSIEAALGSTSENEDETTATTGLFSLLNRRFGQPEYATRIIGAVQNVKGVVWALVDNFGPLIKNEDTDTYELPDVLERRKIITCSKTRILSLGQNNLNLIGIATESNEEC